MAILQCDESNDPYDLDNRPSLRLLFDKDDLVGAEIGVRWGCNALRMLYNLDIKKLYLIDPYKPFPILRGGLWMGGDQKICDQYKSIARHNLSGHSNIEWVEGFSYDVVDDVPDELDFVYIDGDHRYEAVKQDVELYLPKVRSGGLFAGHDFSSTPDTTKAIKEIFGGNVNHEGDDWWVIV